MTKKILRIAVSVSILLLIGYFYFQEFERNWTALRNYTFTLNAYFLALSLLLLISSYLLDAYVWKVCANHHCGEQKLTYPESVSIVNASALFKYLPGRIWIYTAQLAWLQKYGISKSRILHVNVLCIIASMTVSLYLGLVYVTVYTDVMNAGVTFVAFTVLILLNVIYIVSNHTLLNKVIAAANRYFNKDIQPLLNSVPLLVYMQFVNVVSWFITGLSGYYLGKGVGLQIMPGELFAILASMSLSWLVGYLSVITPGGFGVREGFMLLMLNRVTNIQTALLFPILSRILYLLAEAVLGVVALVIGFRLRVFSPERCR